MSLNFANYSGIKIPEGKTKTISRKMDGMILWRNRYINRVPLSIHSDGSIYNNGLGYKNGYRVRSGGAEAAQDAAACTGFIPVKGGDVVRICGWSKHLDTGNAANAINVANSSFTNIGQISNANYGIFATDGGYTKYGMDTIENDANGVSKWVVPPDESKVSYIRVSAFNYDEPNKYDVGSYLIVTINEEIE